MAMNKVVLVLYFVGFIFAAQTAGAHEQIKEGDPDCCKYSPTECCFAQVNRKLLSSIHQVPPKFATMFGMVENN